MDDTRTGATGRDRRWALAALVSRRRQRSPATGLAQLAWVLERIGSASPGLRCTTRPETWLAGDAELFVWEAFVSGTGKPVPSGISQHAADAADTFVGRLEEATLSSSDVV